MLTISIREVAIIAAKMDQTVNEKMPAAIMAALPADTVSSNDPPDTVAPTQVPPLTLRHSRPNSADSSVPGTATTQPTAAALKSGNFIGADDFHKGSGQATIYRGPDGSYLLRLEDFNGTNGPDLRVILSPHPNPQGRDEVSAPGYIDLGTLKGNVGNQNYEIPDNVDIDSFSSVVIYCRAFHVLFSVASLQNLS